MPPLQKQLKKTWLLPLAAALNLTACLESTGQNSNTAVFPMRPRLDLSAKASQFTTPEETPLQFSLPVSASLGTAGVLVTALPRYGSLTQNGDLFVYTPLADFNGSDSLTFAASQSGQTSQPATASITVTPINDAPRAENLAIVTSEDMPFSGSFNAFDPEGDELSYSVVTASSNGTVVIDTLLEIFRFTPKPGFAGETAFYYRASDGQAQSTLARVDVLVLDNDPPVLSTVQIAGGAARVQNLNTTLTLAADASASDMKISGDVLSPDSSWRPYAAVSAIQLTPGDGLKTVRVQVRDYVNNKSAIVTDSIELDQAGPVVSLAYPTHTSLTTLSIAVAATDPSPPLTMRVRGQVVATTPANVFNSFGPLVDSVQITLSGGDAAKTVTLEVADGFNHRSTETISIVLDRQAPTGEAYAALLFVDPVLAAANPLSTVAEATSVTNLRDLPVTAAWNDITSPVTAVILWGDITNAGFFDLPSAAQTVSGVGTLAEFPNLTSGDGDKLLYGRVVDAAGNRGPLFSFAVTLDTTPPALSAISLAGGAEAVSSPTLGFATVTLAVSGVDAAYSMSITAAFNPLAFIVSPPLAITYYAPTLPLIYSATSGQNLLAWVRVFDRAGNASVLRGDSVLLDNVAPFCTPSANPVSVTTANRQTTLTFCSGNVSGQGVTQIQLSGDFVGAPYSIGAVETLPVTLTTGNGPKVVTVVLKDTAGNADNNTLNLYLDVPPFNDAVTITPTFLDFVTGVNTLATRDGGSGVFLGGSLLWLPDINDDDVADVAVAATRTTVGFFASGDVRIHSGANLSPLSWVTESTASLGEFGAAMALAGDFHADGEADLVVGAPNLGAFGGFYVYRLSSLNNDHAARLSDVTDSRYGASLAAIDDLNGDGIGDLLVGAPGKANSAADNGRLQGVSGANFSGVLFTLSGAADDHLGTAIAALGDINDDGKADFAVGAAPESVSGYALLVSGGNRSILQTLRGANNVNYFGAALTLLESNNTRWLAVGAPREVSGANTTGAVYLFDTATGQRQAVAYGGRNGDRFGSALANIGDWDGDGWPDLVVGAPEANYDGNNGGSLYVLSGDDLEVLVRWDSGANVKKLGRSLADGVNVNANHLPEIVAGAPEATAGGSNSGSVLLLTPSTLTRYAGAGTTASFTLTAAPSVVTVQANLDNGGWQTLDDFNAYFAGITEGGHSVQFRGFSAYGETGPASSYSWQSDQTPPQTTSITEPSDGGATVSRAVAGGVTDSVSNGVGGHIRGIRWAAKQTTTPSDLWWDGYSFSLLAPYYFFESDAAAWTFTGPYSTAGTYEVLVQGLDGAFNRSTTAASSSFDYTP